MKRIVLFHVMYVQNVDMLNWMQIMRKIWFDNFHLKLSVILRKLKKVQSSRSFKFEEVNALDVEKTKSYYNQIRSGDLCDCCRNYITWIWLNFVVTSLYRHSSHNREFHNVNCRFCGAIHNVNWACISVLSQVIHSVNERKTVQTNMISFVSHGAGILKISWSSASQNFCSEAQRNARRTGTSYFVCTVFLFINL